MDQNKIGKLIAECRKEKNLTQKELAEKLNVSSKSVSKWECGTCLPDVSLYKDICGILGITLNEFFAGERIAEQEFKNVADENLFNALENSIFTLKDKIDFFKRKWQREHLFELILTILIIIIFIVYGFIKNNDIQYLFIILGFISGIIENNRMMAYLERNVYGKKSDITIEEFRNSLDRLKESKEILSKFETKEEAVAFLVKETNLPKEECSSAYDLIMKLDLDKIKKIK